MPKLKSHSGAAKRFKISKGGKVKYKKANLRHMLSCKEKSRKRALGKPGVLNTTQANIIKKILPY